MAPAAALRLGATVALLAALQLTAAQKAMPPVIVTTDDSGGGDAGGTDYSSVETRIVGHNLVLTSQEQFHDVFVSNANISFDNETECFDTYGLDYMVSSNFTGNVTTGDYSVANMTDGLAMEGYLSGAMGNLTFGNYTHCCLNPVNTSNSTAGLMRQNFTIVRCYLNETILEAIKFNFEKEEEDLVRSHWENFQHPKPTILYKQLANNMREEIRSNFIRTQTVKYEHDIVKESLHNETVRVKTTLDEKKAENRRKMDLLFARHKARVTGLHAESANVLNALEYKRRDTSDHLADLKEDHLATIAALNQNAREVDEHLRVKTEEHMDSMSNYYQRWHDNHEDAEETILNLRRSNGRVGEGMEDAGEYYFGNPEPVINITEVGNTSNTTAATDDGSDRRRRLAANENVVGSTKNYDIIREDIDDDADLWITDRQAAGGQPGGCVAWRQTAECNGDGEREVGGDESCQALIEPGRSGVCECGDGTVYRVDCGHVAFTCAAACGSDQTMAVQDDAARSAARKAAKEVIRHAAAARRAKAEAGAAQAAQAEMAAASAAGAAAAELQEGSGAAAARSEPPGVPERLAGVSDPTTPGWRPRLGSKSPRAAALKQKPAAAVAASEEAARPSEDVPAPEAQSSPVDRLMGALYAKANKFHPEEELVEAKAGEEEQRKAMAEEAVFAR